MDFSKFFTLLQKMCATEESSPFLELLKPELDALFKKGVSGGALNLPVTVETPARRTSPAYECWIGTWLSKFPKLSENATKPAITSAFQHLRAYRVTLDLNAHVPFEQALRYLTEKFDEFARIQSSDRDRQLVALYQQGTVVFTFPVAYRKPFDLQIWRPSYFQTLRLTT